MFNMSLIIFKPNVVRYVYHGKCIFRGVVRRQKERKQNGETPARPAWLQCLLHNIPILFESPFIYHKIKNSRREGAGVTRLFKRRLA